LIYLLDTDVMIFVVRGLKPGRRPAQQERAQELVNRCREVQTAGDRIALSAITISELEFGACNSENYEAEIEAVRKVLAPFDVYDYDSVSCPPHYGRVRHELEAKGMDIGAMDMLIAAHTLALDATLVTNNLAHFKRVTGLRTANWVSRR
jgi:tRNA(fMet)-specific endonuclease VapC